MKKPLPVKIVEAIGWVYIALAVLLLFRAVIELPSVPATESICIGICFLVPTLLAVGMLVSLRRRRRGWFVVPNTMLLSLLVAGLALDSLDHACDGLVLACVVSSLFLIVPLVLLYLPSSTLWFKEKTEDVAESNGCRSVIGQFFCVASTLVFEAVVAIAGFRCYVNYCYVDSWLEGCRPHMTVGEVFSVVPYRFHRDCPLKQVDRAMPHVCFFPSDCSKVELEYSCRLRSDVDGLCLFASSCELYFDKDRRLVGIEYIPYHYTMDNNAWKQFIACRSSGPTSDAVVVASAAGSEVYMPVTDWYVQKWERHE